MKLKVEYGVTEVARLCGVSRWTVRRWIENGEVRARRRGRVWRITNAALRESPDLWDSILFKRDVSR